MTHTFRGVPAPDWLASLTGPVELHPIGYLFDKVKYVPGPGKADEYQRLSLTMRGVLPRSKDDNEGLQPGSFDDYQLLRPNQLVFKLIDLENVSTSRVGISDAEGLVSPAYIVVEATDSVMPKYAYWYFTDLYNRQIFNRLGEDGVRSSLSWEGLKKLPFPSRSLKEQERIVRFLDEETAKIDNLIKKQEALSANAQSRLSEWREHAFWGGATANPFEFPPDTWIKIPNRHLFTHADRRSESGDEEMLSVSHITGVTPRSMKNVNMFEAESTVGYNLVGPGQLVINTMWAWMGALGVSAYAGIVSPAYDVYSFRDNSPVRAEFIDTAYRTRTYTTLMKANSRGIWESRLRLYPEIFLRLPALIPPPEVQDRIVNENKDRTKSTDELVDKGQRLIALLKERRSALITAAVTGQIEV